MSQHAALVFCIGLASLCVLGAAVFFVWLLISMLSEVFGGRAFIKNSELHAHRVTPRFNVGQDAK